MDWIAQHWTDVIQIILQVIGVASAIAALTPTPVDDGIIKSVKKVLNVLGLNVGHAKPQDN